MAFDLDRIDGSSVLPLLRAENFSFHGEMAMIELPLSSVQDIEVYIPASGEVIESAWLELAIDVLAHLRLIDNEVQRVSAEQWAATSVPSSYYEGNLAYITLTRPGEAVMRYFVDGCNSEWDERFVRRADRWVRVAEAQPDPKPGSERA